MRNKTGQIATVIIGAALIAFVLWMPRQPESAAPAMTEMASADAALSDDPVAIAVEKVSGANPMEGIL